MGLELHLAPANGESSHAKLSATFSTELARSALGGVRLPDRRREEPSESRETSWVFGFRLGWSRGAADTETDAVMFRRLKGSPMHASPARVVALFALAALTLMTCSGCLTYATAEWMEDYETQEYVKVRDVASVSVERSGNDQIRLLLDIELEDDTRLHTSLVLDRNGRAPRSLDTVRADAPATMPAAEYRLPTVVLRDDQLPVLVRKGIAVRRVLEAGDIAPAMSPLSNEELESHAIVVLRTNRDRDELRGWMHIPASDHNRDPVPFPLYEDSGNPYSFAVRTPGTDIPWAGTKKAAIGSLLYPLAIAFDIVTLGFMFI